MASPTLNSVSLGNLEMISQTKDLNITPITLPGLDDDDTEVFDLGGALTTITLTGSIVGTSTANVKTGVDNLIAIADGNQDSTVTLSTDQTGSLSVKIATMDFVWEVPGINKCMYTIKVIKGT